MSRGWESKSVEEQQAEATRPKADAKPHLTAEQAAIRREKDSLLLSRKSVIQQIQSTRNSRHKQMLETALADLDAKIAQLT
jgi:L-serine deaminase